MYQESLGTGSEGEFLKKKPLRGLLRNPMGNIFTWENFKVRGKLKGELYVDSVGSVTLGKIKWKREI